MALNLLVVIPAFNEQRFIEGCITSICTHLAGKPLTYQIVVVDNGSTDETASRARQHGADVVSIERATVSRARNVGAHYTPSQFIAFIDADVVVTDKWGEAIAELISHPRPHPILTGCQYSVRNDAGWIEANWFQNIKDKHLNGGNIIVSHEAFERTGGFDEALKTGEDYDFCIRAQNKGVEYKIDNRYIAIHLGYPRDIKNFVKRELWHGEGDFRSFQTFIKSPVAMLGIAYAVGVLLFIFLALAPSCKYASIVFIMLVTGNLILTNIRFHKCGKKTLLINSAINFIYFIARALSLFRALANKRKQY